MSEPPEVGELTPADRTLMGPGPSPVHPRVLQAMGKPVLGHLDPEFVEIMDEVQELLRYTFRTENKWTIPVSGTGSAAMETAFLNLIEPNDTVLVPTNGYFGGRMGEMASRAGGEVVEVDAKWGEPLDPIDVEEAFDEYSPDVFGFVHAETSTGVLQPNVPELTSVAHENDALVIADTVTSLGGVELEVDDWNIDVAYSGSQKALSVPPGISPLTVSNSAMNKILGRETEVNSWYLDLTLLENYWGDERAYHHTAPISSVYGLREGLRMVAEEGIEERWDRHRHVANKLKSGLKEMGLEMNAPDEYWLPTLNAVRVPEGVDDDDVINKLLEEYDLLIAGGLGDLSGDILRIGCMGYGAREKNIHYVLGALEEVLTNQGLLD